MYTCAYACICVSVLYMYLCVVCMLMYICVWCVCIHVSVYVCVCIKGCPTRLDQDLSFHFLSLYQYYPSNFRSVF
jgi:hypothetical protein